MPYVGVLLAYNRNTLDIQGTNSVLTPQPLAQQVSLDFAIASGAWATRGH